MLYLFLMFNTGRLLIFLVIALSYPAHAGFSSTANHGSQPACGRLESWIQNETYGTQKPSGKLAAESHICDTLAFIFKAKIET